MKEDEETTQKKEGDDTDDTSDVEAEERNDRVGATYQLTTICSTRYLCLWRS